MKVVREFDKFSNQAHRCIDNGVFLDGQDKTLEEAGVRSTWKRHEDPESKEIEKPKKNTKNNGSKKIERLKNAAKGTRSIKTLFN